MAVHVVKVGESEAAAPNIKVENGVAIMSFSFHSDGPANPSALDSFALDYTNNELSEVSLDITIPLRDILIGNLAFADQETRTVIRKTLLDLADKISV